MVGTKKVPASVVLILLALSCWHVQAQPPTLFVTASIDVGDYVTVTGKVFVKPGISAPEAVVTVMALDPFGSAIHISRTLTDENGSFSAKFTLTPRILEGKYIVYITASKEGYAEGYYAASFPITVGDFLVSVSSGVVVVEQGQTATYNISIIGRAGFNDTVSLSIGTGLPSNAPYEFSRRSVKVNASLTLSIKTTTDVPTGNYTFTIIGSSPFRSRSSQVTLLVTPRVSQSMVPSYVAAVLAVALTSALLVGYKLRAARLRKKSKVTRRYLATTRALVKLEELRATDKIDQETYLKLKREYEEKLEKERESTEPGSLGPGA